MPNRVPSRLPSPDISYTIRVSRRARYARLKVSPHEGLIVVVPEGFDRKLVPELVESRRLWITKVQGSFDLRRVSGVSDTGAALPSTIDLQGIGESWRVSYAVGKRAAVSVRELQDGELQLNGAVHDVKLCLSAIESWLRRRASGKLVPQFERLASIHGFSFSAVSVRKQRSRWGSCSSRGAISLNLKLLFLPPMLVRYIMIHELCHTRHMNHSRSYWSEVGCFDPDFLAHDREMRHAWRYVPGWLVVRE